MKRRRNPGGPAFNAFQRIERSRISPQRVYSASETRVNALLDARKRALGFIRATIAVRTGPTARSRPILRGSKGKGLALRFAEKMTAVEIDAPGAKLSVAEDRAVFKTFAAACRRWK
jgi:hypothetical protein